MSRLIESGGQSAEVWASASVPLRNIQASFLDWFPFGLIRLISLQSKGLSRVFSSITIQKHQLFSALFFFFMVQLSHPYMTTAKNHSFDYTYLYQQSDISAFQYTEFVIAFLPRSKRLLFSWLQSSSAVILEPKKIKSITASTFPLSIRHQVMGLDAIFLVV